MIALGIDIGGTSVKIAARQNGRVLWTGQGPFYSKPTAAALVESIRSAVAGRLSNADAVGMCVPGLLDAARGVVTLSVNVPGLIGLPLDDLAAAAIGARPLAPVVVLNDAAAAAHDIFHAREISGRLLVLALGTGVGAAVLDDGAPLKVEGECPGHLGQLDVSLDGEPVVGPDGGAGGLEGYIGAPALARRYGADVSAVLARFAGDEPPLRALARAVRIAHAIYRPHHVVLSGGVGIRLRHLLPALRERVEFRLTSVARVGWTFSVGDSDFHAALGAAAIAGERHRS